MASPAPFATPTDLAARLGRNLTDAEVLQAPEFLADASAALRAEIGWQVYPATEVTVTLPAVPRHREGDRNVQWWTASVYLPGKPIQSITSVTVPVVDLGQFPDAGPFTIPEPWYSLIDGLLWLRWSAEHVTVTYEVGYATAPDDLKAWTCVIAADQLARASMNVYGAVPATVGVDDFKIGYSLQQQAGELPVPLRVLQRLRSTYGDTTFVT